MIKLLLMLLLLMLFARNSTTYPTATNRICNEFESQNSILMTPDLLNIASVKPFHLHNNPGNLRCPKTGNFKVYETLDEGYTALLHDLDLKITGRSAFTDSTTTIHDFIAIYAPAFENDVNAYLRLFCIETGLQAQDLLGAQRTEVVARGIIKMENINLYHQLYSSK